MDKLTCIKKMLDIISTDKLYGFENEIKAFLKSLNSQRLHHSWLISGPQSVGKAKFANFLTKGLLSITLDDNTSNIKEFNVNSSISQKVQSRSHPDLLVIDSEEIENGKIGVEEIREIGKFLSLTSVESKYRVIIIDSIDQMNINGANALLKLLEEPSKNVIFFVICHQLGKVIPTIRSRCRILRVPKLNQENFASVIKQSYPNLEDYEIEDLYLKSDGSIYLAINLLDSDNKDIFDKTESAIYTKDKNDILWLAKTSEMDAKWSVIRFALEKCLHKKYVHEVDLYETDQIDSMEKLKSLRKMIADIDLFHLDRGQALISILL